MKNPAVFKFNGNRCLFFKLITCFVLSSSFFGTNNFVYGQDIKGNFSFEEIWPNKVRITSHVSMTLGVKFEQNPGKSQKIIYLDPHSSFTKKIKQIDHNTVMTLIYPSDLFSQDQARIQSRINEIYLELIAFGVGKEIFRKIDPFKMSDDEIKSLIYNEIASHIIDEIIEYKIEQLKGCYFILRRQRTWYDEMSLGENSTISYLFQNVRIKYAIISRKRQ